MRIDDGLSSIETVLHAAFPGRVQQQEPLSAHSSARVGGPADIFLDLESTTECEELVRFCAEARVPLLIIGNGSNILFPDQGVRGIVARMNAKTFRLEEEGENGAIAIVDAGFTWPELIERLAQHGWGSGLHFAHKIPGTVGGALVTNAGFSNAVIGQNVQWAEILDARGCNAEEEGGEWAVPQVRRYTQADLQFGNRQSRFRERQRARITASGQLLPAPHALITPPEIILRLGIRVHRGGEHQQPGESGRVQRPIESFAGYIGPLFKDPGEGKASQLIEQAGVDRWRKGPVQVSEYNANFLVNQGGAWAADIITMIVTLHQQVLARTGIPLEVDLEVYDHRI